MTTPDVAIAEARPRATSVAHAATKHSRRAMTTLSKETLARLLSLEFEKALLQSKLLNIPDRAELETVWTMLLRLFLGAIGPHVQTLVTHLEMSEDEMNEFAEELRTFISSLN